MVNILGGLIGALKNIGSGSDDKEQVIFERISAVVTGTIYGGNTKTFYIQAPSKTGYNPKLAIFDTINGTLADGETLPLDKVRITNYTSITNSGSGNFNFNLYNTTDTDADFGADRYSSTAYLYASVMYVKNK